MKKIRPVDKMRKQKMGGTNGKVIERKKIEIGKQKRIWITRERERERVTGTRKSEEERDRERKEKIEKQGKRKRRRMYKNFFLTLT